MCATSRAIQPSFFLRLALIRVTSRFYATNTADSGGIKASLFSNLSICNGLKRAITKDMGFSSMTPVQTATLPLILSGVDVLAKAKTGTGKTVAFLVPTLEKLARSSRSQGAIRSLILSPTRELAAQTAKEAKALSLHIPDLRISLIVGGNKTSSDSARLAGEVDVLVATPGRLKDHCENTPGFARRLKGCEVLILDEGDQLLAAGFRSEIESILRHVSSNRQSLCFSATLPPDLAAVLRVVLKANFVTMDCVGEEDPDTHARVEQTYATVALKDLMATVHAVLRSEIASDPVRHKVILFFPTARQTQFAAEALNALGVAALEIHSRMSQSKREKTAAAFRAAQSAVMCSSDVSARGMDYPDVSLVLQVGPPSNRENYIHRLGRTGRAGKRGRGCLLLAPYESPYVLPLLKGLPLLDRSAEIGTSVRDSDHADVRSAVARVPHDIRASAYASWLGFYNGLSRLGWSKDELVVQANLHGREVLGLASPPPLETSILYKMGLVGVPGLNIARGGERVTKGGKGGGPPVWKGGGPPGRRVAGAGGNQKQTTTTTTAKTKTKKGFRPPPD